MKLFDIGMSVSKFRFFANNSNKNNIIGENLLHNGT